MASVLITGSSRGIGMATALVFARAGHTVHATMRDPRGSSELVDAAEKEALPITVSAMDVDSDDSVRNAIEAIGENGGSIDVLINNAGILNRGVLEEVDISKFRAVMETNFFGPLRCIKAVFPTMRARRSGTIVNITSMVAPAVFSPLDAYCASKAALEALSEVFAQEAKLYNVRVAIVEPGIANTEMMRDARALTDSSAYPYLRRHAALAAAALKDPVYPSVIGQKILEVVESGAWELRHPAGPGSEEFLRWRAEMTDEQWLDWWAADDRTWQANVARDLGLDVSFGD